MDKQPVIGIDLGTRNALAACLDEFGAVKLIPNRWGNTVTHSVVGLGDNGWVIGEDAVRLGLSGSTNVWWDLKRKVGTDFCVSAKMGTRTRIYTAQELLVPLLEGLREDAEAYLKSFISSCVLAVPAGFTVKQREAMARAAARAGMTDVRIIAEPTAAALAFGRPGRFLVLDFGAGTVDLSVVESESTENSSSSSCSSGNFGVLQVLESMGTDAIGGYEFDIALAEWLRESLLLDPMRPGDPRWTVLLQEAEKIKIALSDCWTYHWNPPPLGSWTPPDLTVCREDLERLMRFPIRRLTHTVRRLWKRYDPEHLLMVGGSSRIPLLQEILAQDVALPERLSLCAEDAVVRGAALYTAAGRERLLLDALSGDLVAIWEGHPHTLVQSESVLPAHVEVNLKAEDEGRARLDILQSQNEMRPESVNLASVELDVRSGEKVLLTCDLSASGLLDAALHREDHSLVHVPLTLAAGSDGSLDLGLAALRRMDELKLAVVSIEPYLSSHQRDRVQLLFRKTEPFVSDPEVLTLLEELVRDLKIAVNS